MASNTNPFNNMPKLGVPNVDTDLGRSSNASGYGQGLGFSESPQNFQRTKSLIRGPTAAEFDQLFSQVQDFIFKVKSLEIKSEQFETVNKRMALVELNSQKVGAACSSAIEEFKIHVEGFKDRINQQELETESCKRSCGILVEDFEVFQETMKKFRQETTYDVQDTKNKVENKLIAIKIAQSELTSQVLRSERLCDEMTETVEEVSKASKIHEKKIERLEVAMEKVQKFGAKKMDMKDQFELVKASIETNESLIRLLKKNLNATDVYIDRYLPCRILNIIKEITEESFSDYDDRKIFLTKLDNAFMNVKTEIEENEFQAKNMQKSGNIYSGRGRGKQIRQLDKTFYEIPNIEIPPTLESEEEEEEEEEDEKSDEEFSSSSSEEIQFKKERRIDGVEVNLREYKVPDTESLPKKSKRRKRKNKQPEVIQQKVVPEVKIEDEEEIPKNYDTTKLNIYGKLKDIHQVQTVINKEEQKPPKGFVKQPQITLISSMIQNMKKQETSGNNGNGNGNCIVNGPQQITGDLIPREVLQLMQEGFVAPTDDIPSFKNESTIEEQELDIQSEEQKQMIKTEKVEKPPGTGTTEKVQTQIQLQETVYNRQLNATNPKLNFTNVSNLDGSPIIVNNTNKAQTPSNYLPRKGNIMKRESMGLKKQESQSSSATPNRKKKNFSKQLSIMQQKSMSNVNYEEMISESQTVKDLKSQIADLVQLKELQPQIEHLNEETDKFRTLMRSFQKDLFNDRKNFRQTTDESMQKLKDSIVSDTEFSNSLTQKHIKKLSTDFMDKLALQQKKLFNLQSDFQLEVQKCRNELGLSNKNLSSKVNLYSLFRLQEMVLQFLMINNINSSLPDHSGSAELAPKRQDTQQSSYFEETENDSNINIKIRGSTFSKYKGVEIKEYSPKHKVEFEKSEISPGALHYQKERFNLRSKQILEEAWLVYQQMDYKTMVFDENLQKFVKNRDVEISSSDISKLYDKIKKRDFHCVQNFMQPLRHLWLDNDFDASLTIKSLKVFEDAIKCGNKSTQQSIINKHVNKYLWDEMHNLKTQIFNLPVSIAEDHTTSFESKHVSKIQKLQKATVNLSSDHTLGIDVISLDSTEPVKLSRAKTPGNATRPQITKLQQSKSGFMAKRYSNKSNVHLSSFMQKAEGSVFKDINRLYSQSNFDFNVIKKKK